MRTVTDASFADHHSCITVQAKVCSKNTIQRVSALVGLGLALRYPYSMIDESLMTKVASLSPADRLEFIGAIWDTLSPEDLPLTDAERALLDARLVDMECNPDDQSPWPEVKARLERLTP
jgi:putative addiction module component (TIGR02574 family)